MEERLHEMLMAFEQWFTPILFSWPAELQLFVAVGIPAAIVMSIPVLIGHTLYYMIVGTMWLTYFGSCAIGKLVGIKPKL